MPLEVFINRLLCALVAGVAIGVERQLRKRNAGLAVNALVSVGACIFILISENEITSAINSGGMVNNDNLRVLSQVVTGIGFLGAGVIMKDGFTIHGLNSACGYGMWRYALAAVGVVLFINWIIKNVEIYFENKREDKEEKGK